MSLITDPGTLVPTQNSIVVETILLGPGNQRKVITRYLPPTPNSILQLDANGNIGALASVPGNGIISAGSPGGTGGVSYGSVVPITLYVKSVTIKTSGTPADIATITIPAGITRYGLFQPVVVDAPFLHGSAIIAETAAGSLQAAAFRIRTAAGGAGTAIGDTDAEGPFDTSISGLILFPGGSDYAIGLTAQTLYIRQTVNSANAGTCSFYITIYPLP